MTDNPYEPPKSEVQDASTRRLVAARPKAILQAIALLWISSGLGFAGSLSEVKGSQGALIFSAVVMVVLAVALSAGIWRGRNWARILYLILVLLSLTNLVSTWGLTARPQFEVALEAVSFVADTGSFFLMFTPPGSLWFQYATRAPGVG
jgi:lipopolysaccharide export LptBFGC system permease protein LptF